MKHELVALGYWHSLLEPDLPDPARFIDPAWAPAERQQVLTYLQHGRPLVAWMGYSWCRFRCGIRDPHLGAWDLTDGTYLWPEGLSHYVAAHQVRLPEEVVQHILQQERFPIEQANQVAEEARSTFSWWRAQQGTGTAAQESYVARTAEEQQAHARRTNGP